MLLTLSTRSLASRLSPTGDGSMTMLDVPDFTIRHLRLRGLNLVTSLMAGWSLEQLDQLRDAADKSGCPCLVLIEDAPLALIDQDPRRRRCALERVQSLAVAAHRLSCNSIALRLAAPDTEEAFEDIVHQIKDLMPRVERYELNLLVMPCEGLTFIPERLIELIKRISTFRIGALPSFGHAAQTGDTIETLRKLAPYAGAIQATVAGFSRGGRHNGYDLKECVVAVRSVGFLNPLAIDFVGNGDALNQIDRAREALQKAIELELQ